MLRRLARSIPPSASLSIALTQTLERTDLEEVLEFIEGKRDIKFGRGSGDQFKRMLQTNLEALYRATTLYAMQAARRSHMDVADLVEDLAADRVLSSDFRRHVDEGNATAAARLVQATVQVVLQTASAARTQTGCKITAVHTGSPSPPGSSRLTQTSGQ